jgi:predicted GNAT superfamily acetyltransferase
MSRIVIRDADTRDWPAIAALNTSEVQHTSPMNESQLDELDQLSAYHRVAIFDEKITGFALAMRENCGYENENFGWFSKRYDQFLYVDRIVVDRSYAGRGMGSALYRDLFDFAAQSNVKCILCEIDLDPPNTTSMKFHAKHGFVEVGQHKVIARSKMVSLQAADL